MFDTQEENFKNVEIGGSQYAIHRFSPTPALKLSTRLAKFIGPAIAEAVKDFQANNKDKKAMTKSDLNMSKIILAILPSLDEEVVSSTVRDLVSCVSYEGSELKGNKYEQHFTGKNMKNLFPLVGAVVEYQFSDFLSGLLTER